MRVFLAGAGGVIGRPLTTRLLAAGHQVTGMTRSLDRAQQIRAAGAEAVVCDVLDAQAIRDAVREATPEAVIHQLTTIPQRLEPRKYSSPATPRPSGPNSRCTSRCGWDDWPAARWRWWG